MRIREMLEILDENIDYLEVEHVISNNKYELINLPKISLAINKINELGFIDNQFEIINKDLRHVFNDRSPQIWVDTNVFEKVKNVVSQVYTLSIAVFNALNQAISEQDELSISFKLPHYNQLSEVATFIKDIDNICGQTLTGKFKANVKFQNFDTGSEWIEIVIDNKEAFLFFGQIVSSAFKYLREHLTQLKQTQSILQTIEIDEKAEEARKLMLEALDNNVKAQARLNAKMLMEDFNIDIKDNDYHGKLTYSISKLAELIQKGTEVHTAINAPEDSKEVYPDPKQLILVDKDVKFISEKNPKEKDQQNEDNE
ncbi:hypothetical protein [Psychrobacillus psychrodurans]|uniref:hypothetical protein n=1 Tax=Psychrobacillus psychrodurans TaxID=126157 RepID=UPI0008E15878|nr:hypothetical protein [Psychrobacillus psychrodurans]MCZ8541951.1 hypothetical protein [Psychrobacillus psychrodurans]SFN14267.1 hypothetical protein SAMN05421832_11666 [Psychrobacillus psychrodurans]